MEIIFPDEITSKINTSNALGKKIAVFVCVVDGVIIEAVNNLNLTIGTGVSVSGSSMVFDGTTDADILMLRAKGSPLMSFYGRVKYNVTNVDQTLMSISSAPSTHRMHAWADTAGGLRTRIFAGAGTYGEIGQLTQDVWHNWGGKASKTTNQATTFYNGLESVPSSSISNGDWGNYKQLSIGSSGGTSRNLNGEMEYFALFHEELTDAEFLSLNDNPFQVMQTKEDVQAEFGLQLADAMYVSVGSTTLTADFSITVDFVYKTTTSFQSLLGDFGASGSGLRINSTTDVFIKFGNELDTLTLSAALVVGNRYVWEFKRVSGVSDILDTSGASLVTSTFASTQLFTYSALGVRGSLHFEGILNAVRVIDPVDNTNDRHWTFNHTFGETTIDHINGVVATLVGFPADNASTVKWQEIIPVDVFTVGDYADIPSFVSAQNADINNQKEYQLDGSSLGGAISGFAKGLKLKGASKADDITSTLTLTTTGFTQLENLTALDIDATGAADVHLFDVEAANVTG